MIWLPSMEHILLLHQKMIDHFGGAPGVRDRALIESALARANAAFGGVDAHQGIAAKAAAVGCGLTQNHGFIDGNKRTGIAVMLLILRRNGVHLSCTQEEVIRLGLSVAQGIADVNDVCEWIEIHHSK